MKRDAAELFDLLPSFLSFLEVVFFLHFKHRLKLYLLNYFLSIPRSMPLVKLLLDYVTLCHRMSS